MKFTASGPITSWQIEGEKVETVTDFIFLGSKITAEDWAPKKWCFSIVVLEKTLESPLDSKANQSVLKELSPEYSLEGLMLKLKPQYFGHLMGRANSPEKILMLGKTEKEKREAQNETVR